MTPVNERVWPAEEVLTMACAIYRTKGYTSTSTFTTSDPNSDSRWNNKEHLCYQMVPEIADKDYKVLVKVTQQDVDTAHAIVQYYRRLTFGIIGDTLSDYMQRVFASTQKPEVVFKDFGVLASVPSAYDKEISKKRIEKEAKASVQEHLGKIDEYLVLEIRYINTRFIQKLNCYGHEAITSTGHLVNFLNKIELGKVGTVQKIRAKVRSHGVNFQTKTVETQLNYVKVLDTEYIWQ
jgi:hypothetical protein